jgi:hypothetical protein
MREEEGGGGMLLSAFLSYGEAQGRRGSTSPRRSRRWGRGRERGGKDPGARTTAHATREEGEGRVGERGGKKRERGEETAPVGKSPCPTRLLCKKSGGAKPSRFPRRRRWCEWAKRGGAKPFEIPPPPEEEEEGSWRERGKEKRER